MWEFVDVNWQTAGTGDFNGDGRHDILWRHTDGTLTNWLSNGSGGFIGNDQEFYRHVPVDWQVAGMGDFNGDGSQDILWRNADGTLTDWLAIANGDFVDNPGAISRVVPNEWMVASTGDYNGDGRDDILWRNADGTLTNWLGTANGGFIENGVVVSHVVPTDWTVVGTGDFNGDGRDDILWRNANGALTSWLGASGDFIDNTANAFHMVATEWKVAGVGDFNGDARDDILWRHYDGTVTNWLGAVSGGFLDNSSMASRVQSNDWRVTGIGDFDGDGHDDILWRKDSGTLDDWDGTTAGSFNTVQPFYGGGTPAPPAADPANTTDVLTGPEWDEAMRNAEAFFAEMEAALHNIAAGGDQNSYYREPYADAGNFPTFLQEIPDYMDHAEFQALIDSFSVHPYDHDGIDPEFAAIAFSPTAFSAQYSGGFATVMALASNAATFIFDGVIMQGTWLPGTDAPPMDDAIVVNGGRWAFVAVGYAPNYVGNVQYYGGSPAIDDADFADLRDGQTINKDALGELDDAEKKVLAILKLQIDKVSIMLAQLPPDGKIVSSDGITIYIRELQDLWARADFRIDASPSPTNPNPYNNGGVGQALRNDGNPLFVVHYQGLFDYMHGGVDSALHYVLHELIHVTAAGDSVSRNGGTHSTTANPVESWTSRMAQALAAAGTLAYAPTFFPPPFGDNWGPIGLASYHDPVPPPPPGGGDSDGTGGGSGSGGDSGSGGGTPP